MASNNEAKVKFTAETTEFNSAIKSANSEISSLKAEMKLADATFKNTGDSVEHLQQKHDLLEEALAANREKQEALNSKIESATAIFGEDSSEVQNLQKQLTNAKTEEQSLETQLSNTNSELEKQQKEQSETKSATQQLSDKISEQKTELSELKEKYADAVIQYGKNSTEAKSLGKQIDDLSGELKDNEDALDEAEEAADDLDQTMGSATKSSDTWKVALGNLAADGIKKLASECVELAKETVELGVETETAFAKLETISGTENIDDLTESINALSRETGVSSAELADVAYNAISAGSSAEDAMDMVTAATKLGVAGFTDSSDALSVLSTVMNSYGDTCGSVEEISDSLITVQNLGVTTVGELSSSMGKAIATGSAYNVNLGNLESAYVSLTKSGISTEESTTYLNSMLNELGDSGSTVSGILQEQTGKSFTELMDDGYSLSDVLGILYDDCDGDSTALMNLWSSAEAGKASNAIVNQGLEEFNENLEAITDSSGATETAYATMADTTGTKIAQMKTGFESLGLQIYDGLEGPLNSGIDFVIDSVIPGLSDMITVVGDTGAAAIEFGKDLAGDVSDGVKALSDKVTDDIIPALGDFAETASGKLSDISGYFSEHLSDAATTASGKLSDIKGYFSDNLTNAHTVVSQKLAGVKTFFSTHLGDASTTASTKLGEVKGFFSDNLGNAYNTASTKLSGVAGFFTGYLGDSYDTASTKLSGVATLFSDHLLNSNETTSEKLGAIKEYFVNELGESYNTASEKLSGIKDFFTQKMDAADTKVSTVLGAIDGYFDTDLSSAYNTVSTKMGNIKEKFSDKMEDAKEAVGDAISKIKKKFDFTWSLPKLEMPHISITGSFSINPPSTPKFSISWYKEGGVLESPTIFGMDSGNFLAGGEAGPEAVAPIDVLQDYVATAVESVIGDSLDRFADAIYALANRPVQVSVNGRTFATAVSGDMDSALGTLQALTERGLSMA